MTARLCVYILKQENIEAAGIYFDSLDHGSSPLIRAVHMNHNLENS